MKTGMFTPLLLGLLVSCPDLASAYEMTVSAPSACEAQLKSCIRDCRGNIRKDCELCQISRSQCTGSSSREWGRLETPAGD